MPLSDLFKKSPGKESPQDDPFGSPEMQKKRYAAAMEFLKILQERMPLIGEKPHAGTVLSVAARLAGTSLFRAINKQDFATGVVVLSEEVDEAWPQLMNLFAFYCKKSGIDVMARPLITQFPDTDKPHMNVTQVQGEYQDQFQEVMKRHGLDYLDGARAGMMVCSIVFNYHCTVARDIDPSVATGIVAMGIVEGAKTAPPRWGSGGKLGGQMRNRLVLGEREAAIQEALDHGGIFIDPNPEVLKTLQAGNIDPYLIYERGMLNQIEAKIPRIDFVQADVDQLYDEWKSKSHDNAPIHVRLILWLKSNAGTHGYEQRGNSWVLKG